MSTISDQRLALTREVRGPGFVRSLEPSWGRDPASTLEVRIDATGWVTDVRLSSLSEQLRTSTGLQRALRRAIGQAVAVHFGHNAALADPDPDELAHGRDLEAGRVGLRVPAAFRARPMTLEDRHHSKPPVPDERLQRRATGTSREGELTVELGWVDGFRALRVEEAFLATASPAMVRYALVEAFTAAHEQGAPR